MSQSKNDIDEIVNKCYKDYYNAIYKYCYARLGELNEHAYDCVQDTFLVLQKKLSDGIEIEQPRAFLYRTADTFVMRTKSHYQKQLKRTVQLEEVKDLSSPTIISDDLDYDNCAAMLVSFLSYEEQELYNMKYIQRQTLQEIALKLDISPPAVAKRTSRLRQKIKDLIKEKQPFGNEVNL